jgi:DNA-binding MarR family transcriptional regulator
VKRGSARARTEALALLRALVEELRRSARTIESRTGVSNAQLFLLRELRAHGPLSVNDLAVSARTGPSTASIVVQRLVRAGLAAKARSRADARSVMVTLTPAGRRVIRRAPAPTTAKLISAIEEISDADARALSRGLQSLARALKLAPHAPPLLFEDLPVRRRPK